MKETVAKRIVRLREARGLTRGQLSIALRSSTGSTLVANWELGRSLPSAVLIPKVAQALKVSTDYLLTGKESAFAGSKGGKS